MNATRVAVRRSAGSLATALTLTVLAKRARAAMRVGGTGAVWELDPQSAHRFDTEQSLHQCWAADPHRSLAQLVEPGLPTAFNRYQKFVEAVPLLVTDIVDEQVPQTRLHARTDLGNKPLQYADTGQQYLAGDQPADGVIEQQAGAVWLCARDLVCPYSGLSDWQLHAAFANSIHRVGSPSQVNTVGIFGRWVLSQTAGCGR